MLALGQVSIGSKILFRGAPHDVLQANHLKMGRGGAKLQTKLRNLLDGAVIDYTFAGDERLEEVEISYRNAQFLYAEGKAGHFMFSDTYEQVEAPMAESSSRFLKDGASVDLQSWQNRVIGVKLPKKVELIVTEAEPAVRGNTANTATKNATLETGAVVQVPLFVKTGDKLIINTETGQYDSRA
ncbi:MAG: elongation factor P [Candidatus Berkelbacteria bacterium]|nr:MAG: elongation factor P [Candidatus Berkelbacteria bacterium]QQG51631.1 MAG: elongation factor P [Candidatus Berkelbacteria bacterium]